MWMSKYARQAATRSILVAAIWYAHPTEIWAQSDLSIGYQFARVSTGTGSFNLPYGLEVDYAYPSGDQRRIGGAGDWGRRSQGGTVDAIPVTTTFSQLSVAGGVRYVFRTHLPVVPYLQAMVGVARSSTRATTSNAVAVESASTDLMVQPGVGTNVPVGGRWSIFGQADYRQLWPGQSSAVFFRELVHGIRAVAGVRFSLNR